MRILVLRGGALGDFIVTLPALRALRRRWPSATIELAGNATAAQLRLHSGDLNAVHSQHEARWAQLYRSEPLAADFRSWLDDFDLILSFWSDPEGDLKRHFAPRGNDFVASDTTVNTRPAAAHFCGALARLGIVATDYVAPLTFSEKIAAEVTERFSGFRDFIAIHPGSGSPKKNWPYHRWRELILFLNRPVLLVSGEADAIPDELANLPLIRRAHNWPLPVLGAALARGVLFVGHDSGVSHLAASAGAACLLLFGPTDPAIWAPPYDGVEVLRGNETLDTITVSAVQTKLAGRLGPTGSDRR